MYGVNYFKKQTPPQNRYTHIKYIYFKASWEQSFHLLLLIFFIYGSSKFFCGSLLIDSYWN